MEDTIANGAYLCTIESERWSQLKSYPPFVKDCCCKKKYDAHVVGPADLMMSSELTEHQEQLGGGRLRDRGAALGGEGGAAAGARLR